VLFMQADTVFWDSLVFDGIGNVDVVGVTRLRPVLHTGARFLSPQAEGLAAGRGERRDPADGPPLPLRRTFAEPFTRLTTPCARFTARLGHVLERVGLALAGRAGARLAGRLGFPVGRMTLLRRVMALPDSRPGTPCVLGVDDFATRRGRPTSPS